MATKCVLFFLCKIGLKEVWLNPHVWIKRRLKLFVTQRLNDIYLQKHHTYVYREEGNSKCFISRICHSDHYRENKYLSKIRSPTLRATVTELRVDSNNTKDCKFRSFRFKSFETDHCEECDVKQDVKHILLYCKRGRGILREPQRIFTNNYKQYVPGIVNLCDDKKLKEILNVHRKCNETCIDVATEEICKFIKKYV